MMNQSNAIKLKRPLLGEHLFKRECRVKKRKRNWLDLPSEIMANILYRTGVVEIVQSVQKVCTTWRKICMDPAMWRVVYMDASSDPYCKLDFDMLCKLAVDRSQGQLVDIIIVGYGAFGSECTLEYIANRSSQLKRLTIACCYDSMYHIWTKSLMTFPLLEELSLYETEISEEGIESAGHYCSKLKTLKVNQEDCRFLDGHHYSDGEIDAEDIVSDCIAMAIGQNLHELRHLELIGNPMSNKGLEKILDGCHHLELLDLRGCFFIRLDGDLVKRCLKQIKCVKLPNDSLDGCPYIFKNDDMACHVDDESEGESYDEYEGESDDESEEGSDDE